MVYNGVKTARLDHAKDDDNAQGYGHDDGLNQVHGGHGAEATYRGIADNDDGTDDHGHHIVPAKQAVKQLSDGRQTGGHIGDKENEDNKSRDAHDDGLLLPIPLGDEAGNGDGIQADAVPAQPLRHQKEVQISTESQSNRGPAGIGYTRQVGQAWDAHQQIAAHVAGLGAHCGDQRANAPAS